jgi:hypothetical protein
MVHVAKWPMAHEAGARRLGSGRAPPSRQCRAARARPGAGARRPARPARHHAGAGAPARARAPQALPAAAPRRTGRPRRWTPAPYRPLRHVCTRRAATRRRVQLLLTMCVHRRGRPACCQHRIRTSADSGSLALGRLCGHPGVSRHAAPCVVPVCIQWQLATVKAVTGFGPIAPLSRAQCAGM